MTLTRIDAASLHEQTTTNLCVWCLMNLALGIACPVCGHESANILEFVKDDFGLLIAHRLRCARCETVYLDTRESAGPEEGLSLELVLAEPITRS